jgi:hypothetical protein
MSRRAHTHTLWTTALLLAASCTPEQAEDPVKEPTPCVGAACEPDPEPEQPPVVLDDAVWSQQISQTRAAGLFALGDGVLAQGDGALFFQEIAGPRPVATTEALDDAALFAVAALGQDTLILSTAARLWSLTPEGLAPSPIAARFAQAPPAALAADGADLWLLGPAGLYRWSAGELVRLERAQLGGDVLALIPAPTGQGVWASTATRLHALGRGDDGGVTLATSPARRGAHKLVAAQGAAWALLGGVVYRVGADGSWQELVMQGVARDLAANPGAEDVWIEDETGRVWHFGGGQIVQLGQALRWGDARVVDARGGLIVGDDAGLTRHTRRFDAAFVEVPRAPISAPAAVRVRVAFPERVTSATLRVGAATSMVMIGADGEGEAMIEPASVGEGRHALSLVVRFEGGAAVTLRDRVEVAPFDFTWEQHIKPLYEASCARCHGTQSSRPLDTRERWVESFDAIEGDMRRGIMAQVTQKIMPLPPTPALDAQQLRMLEQWKAKGFLP